MAERIPGIDYLRVAMSWCVVAWHMSIVGLSLAFAKFEYPNHTFEVSDFINFHVLLLAVPTFIFISSALYARSAPDLGALWKRVKRLSLLLVFWPVMAILYEGGYRLLWKTVPSNMVEGIFTILRAGNTIYYFFVSLIICTCITHLFLKLRTLSQILLAVVALIGLALIPLIAKQLDYAPLGAYWSPLNFIPVAIMGAVVG
jgi:hypothetical protein